MNYSKYDRSFIMLEDQHSDFYSKSGGVKGYLKIETGNDTGVLKCSVQNLKYLNDGEYLYKLLLFGKKDHATIYATIGTLSIDKQGNGDYYSRFNPQNIDGAGNGLHDFSAATIVAASTKNTNETLHLVLKGSFQNNETASEETPPEAEQMPLNEKSSEITADTSIYAAKNTPTEIKISELPKHHSVSYQKITNDYNEYFYNYIVNSCSYMENLAKSYEEIQPFSIDKTQGKWWKVLNLMSLPFVNTTYNLCSSDHLKPYYMNCSNGLTSPSCFDLAYKYRHFLFGLKKDEEGNLQKYYYAIPGKYADEHPDGGKSGFSYWQPLNGAEKQQGAYGYWIISIDPNTKEIERIVD
ncbi:MAG: hypothetical protein P4L45_14915, partial [Ignavibacteriaceae bacterium]|nr:hypothetical protein [Ignavibacteriaceae bacterium]